MVINALNSGSDMFMADFEDSLSPAWRNSIEGQINLLAANKKTIEFKNPDGKITSCVFLNLFNILLYNRMSLDRSMSPLWDLSLCSLVEQLSDCLKISLSVPQG